MQFHTTQWSACAGFMIYDVYFRHVFLNVTIRYVGSWFTARHSTMREDRPYQSGQGDSLLQALAVMAQMARTRSGPLR